MPSEDAATVSGGETAVRSCLAHRGYSDPIISSGQPSSPPKEHAVGWSAIVTKLVPPCTCGDHMPPTSQPARASSLSQRVKSRQNLQLPSFRSLGIASGASAGQPGALAAGALPTPPDDTAVGDRSLADLLPGEICRSISFSEGILPTTPGTHDFPSSLPSKIVEKLASDMSAASTSAAPNANLASIATIVQDVSAADQTTPGAGTEGQGDLGEDGQASESDDGGFVTGAIPFTNQVVTASEAPVLHAMCYTQPCPLEGVDTAFNPVLADMESKAKQMGKYIEVTYQMPPKFNMNQIPSSPAATPNADIGATDYFSAHVYTRGIVAHTYESAMAQAGPSSPRPAVAPGSINVAMLERYIPPPTFGEYSNLFSTDMPSALVDRLSELSPNNGTFIFVYPTAQGAKTFLSTYLRPLLDPLLRTIASTHDLSADFPASVGALASLNGELLSFDRTVSKLSWLLRKLSRSASVTGQPSSRATPTFTLVHSDQSVVDIGKEALVDWWLEQEKGRIRKAVEHYFHARRADSTMGMTAKIADGLRKRDYNDYDAERAGIEVGLYVIKRTS